MIDNLEIINAAPLQQRTRDNFADWQKVNALLSTITNAVIACQQHAEDAYDNRPHADWRLALGDAEDIESLARSLIGVLTRLKERNETLALAAPLTPDEWDIADKVALRG